MVKLIDRIGLNQEEEMMEEGTDDSVLNMLRKQRRKQLERKEKEQLKVEIRADRKQQLGEHLFGIKEGIDKKVNLLKETRNNKIQNLLKEKRMLKEKKLFEGKGLLKQKSILTKNNMMKSNVNILKTKKSRKEPNLLNSKTRLL